ncbi:hypothetical protein ES707_09529 [subsurface metagenome]
MSETYRFVWGEVNQVVDGCMMARQLIGEVLCGHIETERFDLDFDRIGVVIRIPPVPDLKTEKEEEENPHILHGEELDRAEQARKEGR